MSHDAHNPGGGTPPPPPRDPQEMLDAYLDGILEGQDLALFEHALDQNPSLKAAVDAQQSIDDSLSRLFHPAEPFVFRGEAAAQTAPSAPAPTLTTPALKLATGDNGALPRVKPKRPSGLFAKPVSPWSAVAAVLVFATLAGLYITGVIDPAKLLGPSQRLVAPEVVYERKVNTGFTPDWVCETDAQFVKNTTDYLGEPLLIRSTDSVEVVGWSYYEPVFSNNTVVLLAKVDGKEVIVAMDRKVHDRTIRLPKSSGLHEFHQVIGNAVLVEVSPFDTPRVLPLVERK